jgi:CTP-dependent riboflavin kinase
MHDNRKVVLKEISKAAKLEQRVSFSFNRLSKNLELTKDDLDFILNSLERDHYITQYVIGEDDDFIIVLHQKGLDALLD